MRFGGRSARPTRSSRPMPSTRRLGGAREERQLGRHAFGRARQHGEDDLEAVGFRAPIDGQRPGDLWLHRLDKRTKSLPDLTDVPVSLRRGQALCEEIAELLRAEPSLDVNKEVRRDEDVAQLEPASLSTNSSEPFVEQDAAGRGRRFGVVHPFDEVRSRRHRQGNGGRADASHRRVHGVQVAAVNPPPASVGEDEGSIVMLLFPNQAAIDRPASDRPRRIARDCASHVGSQVVERRRLRAIGTSQEIVPELQLVAHGATWVGAEAEARNVLPVDDNWGSLALEHLLDSPQAALDGLLHHRQRGVV